MIPGDRAAPGAPASASLDDLARRAVEVVGDLLGRANRLAGRVLLLAGGACLLGYVLGIAALDGGLRTFWIVVGGLAAAWAIGSVLVAMWRVRAIRRGSAALADDVRSLIGRDGESHRTVIDTVESTSGRPGVVGTSRRFFSLRDLTGDQTGDLTELSVAVATISRFPATVALAALIGFVFALLSLVFALVLAV